MSMESLPTEILARIFSYLPIEDVHQNCALTCRSFLSITRTKSVTPRAFLKSVDRSVSSSLFATFSWLSGLNVELAYREFDDKKNKGRRLGEFFKSLKNTMPNLEELKIEVSRGEENRPLYPNNYNYDFQLPDPAKEALMDTIFKTTNLRTLHLNGSDLGRTIGLWWSPESIELLSKSCPHIVDLSLSCQDGRQITSLSFVDIHLNICLLWTFHFLGESFDFLLASIGATLTKLTVSTMPHRNPDVMEPDWKLLGHCKNLSFLDFAWVYHPLAIPGSGRSLSLPLMTPCRLD